MLSKRKDQNNDAVIEEKIIKTLINLIKIKSVSNENKYLFKVVDYVENYFKGLGGIVNRFEYNNKPSIVIQNFKGKKADIILSGHLDVVPPSGEGQFNPETIGGKIFGRGAGDMKGGDAIMMVLMKTLLNENFSDKKITLMLTTDEELGGFDGVEKLLKEGYMATVVLVPDGGDSDKIVIAEKGVIHFHLQVNGKSCHASRPWLGDNAIDKTIQIYNDLKKILQEDLILSRGERRGCSVNLNVINGGDATNTIPNYVEAKFDIRFTEKYKNASEIFEMIKETLNAYDVKILSKILAEYVYTPEKNKVVQQYLKIAKDWIPNVKLTKSHGGSDGRHFASKGGIVFNHRPTAYNTHGKNEYVIKSELLKIYRVYEGFVRS